MGDRLRTDEKQTTVQKEKDMTKVIAFIKAHDGLLEVALIIVLSVVGVLAVKEYKARAAADATVKAAQTDIEALAKQQTNVVKVAKKQVSNLQAQAKSTDTPAKAIEVLTSPTPENMIPLEPLKAEAIPDAPGRISVEALPLYQTLNACSIDKVNLSACTQELDLQKQITDKKDVQITALKQKPTFWHAVGKFAKVVGCSAVGGAAGSYIKGAQGAAIGAAAGAGVCQLF